MSTRSMGVTAVLLCIASFVAFFLCSLVPGWFAPAPEVAPARPPIVATASGVTIDAAGLPYTFGLPTGFVLSLDAGRSDAGLIPEPWLPTPARIRLERWKLDEDVSTMDAARLRQYARVAPTGGWTSKEPSASLTAADSSLGLEYPTDIPDSLPIMVFHGRVAVLLFTSWEAKMSEEQKNTMREAARTVVRSMRFR